ncbi:hypothetical protein PFDSM3638_01165 [Pyrococcus furiosus DSM 3638]|uniref:Uncharacterized protein n=3 Tax=Pyrococcus furiosus TaxID=2261 RepID=A0A5C0XLV7_PYRFU|nr:MULTISPECIES: DUF5748 family protein [Pyrococcus]AAL80370.1 hypothetical protein PF0246 [Pyrococcus furiosus DSM 3638]AFN03032.1 hypothetical protein PFC_00280 [Pyrococcus furiosus COM1]MDK2870542.1 hypothetical protein [Pyrococcus sp.]QEK77966.1 hypothetical protein PFDSM3638_01165 [Pyrococcus furiosus DSM 3638]
MNSEVIKEFLEDIGEDYIELENEIHLKPEVFYEVWKYVGEPELKTYVIEDEIVEPGEYDPPEMKYTNVKKVKIKKVYFETLDNVRVVTDYSEFQKILKKRGTK